MSRLGILEKGGFKRLRDFDQFFSIYYGGDAINRVPVSLEFEIPEITSAVYDPSILKVHNGGSFEKIDHAEGYIQQLRTDTSLAEVIPAGTPGNRTGFTIKVWKTENHIPVRVSGSSGPYETPVHDPISEVTFEKPSSLAANEDHELIIKFTERFGAASVHTYMEHHVRDYAADALTVTTYSGHATDPTQIIKKEYLTYSARGAKAWDYTLTRIVKEGEVNAQGQMGGIVTVAHTREVYQDFSLSAQGGEFGARRIVSRVNDPGGDALTTTYDYYDEPANPLRHGRKKSIVRPNGSWTYYDVSDTVGSATTTNTVYRSYKDVTMANRENAIKIISTAEDETYTRTTYIAGTQVAKEEKTTSTAANGEVTLTEKKWTGSEWATTQTCYYPHASDNVNAGRKKWKKHANGTVTVWEYFNDFPNLQVIELNGAGTPSHVTDGTSTSATYNAANQIIAETVIDIASGLQISSRNSVGVGGGTDSQGRPTKWVYNGNAADYSVMEYGCCGLSYRRDRSGATTNYYRDELRRVYKVNTQRSSTGPVISTTTTIQGLRTTIQRTDGTTTLLVSDTTRSLSGLTTTTRRPDANGDGLFEISTSVTDYTAAGGPTTTMTYPDLTTSKTVSYLDGQTKKSIDQAGYETTYDYGVSPLAGGGRFRLVTPPGGTQWMKSYSDQIGRTVRTEYADGAYSETSFHSCVSGLPGSRGRVATSKDPDEVATAGSGSLVTYSYSADGDDTTVVTALPDGQSRTSSSTRDVIATVTVHGQVIAPAIRSVSIVNGVTTQTSYSSIDGRIRASVSFGRESLSVTTVANDGAWTTISTGADGTFSIQEYSDGLMEKTSFYAQGETDLVNGFVTRQSYDYDAFGRMEEIADARLGDTLYNGYHDNGAVISVTDTAGHTTAYTYDKMGRVTEVDAPDTLDSSGAPLLNKTYTSYTDRGQVEATWGDQTYARFYGYDAQGRMTQLRTYQSLAHGTEPTAGTTGYALTSWVYDSQRGWLTDKLYPDASNGSQTGVGPRYTYTSSGKLKTREWVRTVAGGARLTTTYSYDQGSLDTVSYNDGTTQTLDYTYDNFGRIDSVSQGGVTTHDYTYDNANLRLTTEKSHLGFSPRLLTRKYDSYLRNTGYFLGLHADHDAISEVSHTYDSAGRLSTASYQRAGAANAQSFTYNYLANSGGLIASLNGPAHTVTNTWEANRNILTTRKNHNVADTVTYSQYSYGVNAIGQRSDVARSGTAFSAASTLDWGYNARGELLKEDNSTTNTFDNAYSYDGIGNRLRSVSGSLTLPGSDNYQSNALNQYTATPGATTAGGSISYDLDGNLTDDGDKWLYEWDGENRLIALQSRPGVSSQTRYEYLYDYLGRRYHKQRFTWNGSAWAIHSTNNFVYDGWNVIHESSPSGTYVANYLWGLDLSGSFQGAGGVGGMLLREDTTAANAATPTYRHSHPTYDGNGNVSEYLDENGNIAAHFEYDAFGKTKTATAPTPGSWPGWFRLNVFDGVQRFSTKARQLESGFYYYGYRYYDPNTGRWPSRDPIGERGGLNIYGFVGNNGISRIDRLGLAFNVILFKKATEDQATEDGFEEAQQAITESKEIARSWLSKIEGLSEEEFKQKYVAGDTQVSFKLKVTQTDSGIEREETTTTVELTKAKFKEWLQAELESSAQKEDIRGYRLPAVRQAIQSLSDQNLEGPYIFPAVVFHSSGTSISLPGGIKIDLDSLSIPSSVITIACGTNSGNFREVFSVTPLSIETNEKGCITKFIPAHVTEAITNSPCGS